MTVENLNPEGWPRPSGYSNGTAATGRMVFVAGQVGWHPINGWESDDFVHQVRQCLENTRAVLEAEVTIQGKWRFFGWLLKKGMKRADGGQLRALAKLTAG